METVTVISTGWSSPNKARCIESVLSQRGVVVDHRYVEASKQEPTRTKIENIWLVVHTLPKDRIVALVDGDDCLAHDGALEIVSDYHSHGAWLTYGSFLYSDGRPGFAELYGADEKPRVTRWKATHLKTFRAGLFQRIKSEDLHYQGKWVTHADDLAFMFPMLEMCGVERRCFVPEVLYTYDLSVSREFTAPHEQTIEKAIDAHLRSLPPYPRIASYASRD